jgi:hypothetical protein
VANQGVAASAATAAASVDQFEPPPPGMSAAQMQARAAGAMSPTQVASPVASTPADATPSRVYGAAPTPASAPDAIDAAADAYEPPPPAAVAARQARQAQFSGENRESGGVQIMRASTASRPIPAPTQTNDDPIAGFAKY